MAPQNLDSEIGGTLNNPQNLTISVVIPCFKVSRHILSVIKSIGPEVDFIIIVDDCCPELTGSIVEEHTEDPRVRILFNEENLGVGASVIKGYLYALDINSDIVIKIDGDGQMDSRLIPYFIRGIDSNNGDYVKGNRYWDIEFLKLIPKIRMIGNIALSFISKMSTGYWNLFDPTNGFTAIKASTLKNLDLQKIDKGFFFESDILFHLYLQQAVVHQVVMKPIYGEEQSNLKIYKVLPEFLYKNLRNTLKRIFYSYF